MDTPVPSPVVAHKLPPKHYAAVGALVTDWAHLEFGIERLIWSLLNIRHREGRALTTGMQARPKLDLLRILGKHYAPTEKIADNITELCDEAGALAAKRNDVAHGIWVHPQGNKRLLHLVKVTGNPENRLQPKHFRYTDRTVAKLAKKIRTLRFDASYLLIGVSLTPRASRKQSAPSTSASRRPQSNPRAENTRRRIRPGQQKTQRKS